MINYRFASTVDDDEEDFDDPEADFCPDCCESLYDCTCDDDEDEDEDYDDPWDEEDED